MSSWQDKAVKALEDCLFPVPQELNTIGMLPTCMSAV